MTGEIRIGISGWTYEPWRGTFYPADLPQHEELAFAARSLGSIEINGTFYSLQRPSSYLGWADAAPRGFVFSVKAPRFITHAKRLGDVRVPLANFFASGVLALREKLGPILWQLPPNFHLDKGRLAAFFAQLPRGTREAARLGREHDFRVEGRSWLEVDEDRPLRHALEVRHASFATPGFVELMGRAGVALVTADTAGKWPLFDVPTADFAYARLHGDKRLYVSGYTPRALDAWAAKVRAWSRDRDVFVYFDNDVKVRAPYDAMGLAWRLGLGPKPGRPPALKDVREAPRRPSSWPRFGSGAAPGAP